MSKNNSNDWVKLYRRILKSPVFASPELLQTWIWCLCMASYKERDFITSRTTVIPLRIGEFYCGLEKSAKLLGTTRPTLKRRLGKLAELGMITVKSEHLGTLIFIENFADFQNTANIKRSSGITTNVHQALHKQESIKNIQRKNKENARPREDFLSEKEKLAMARRR